MKKFFLALLGLFVLIGGGLLSACGSQAISLVLSQDSISIEIQYDGQGEEQETGYQTITAEVAGAKDASIIVDTMYEDIISISQQPLTTGKTQITVYGLTEGYAEFMVRTNQGNVYKIVRVDVYSNITALSQKVEESGKISNFAVRSGDNTTPYQNILVDENLLEFMPSAKSRRHIKWSLSEEIQGATIEEGTNVLIVSKDYVGENITITATNQIFDNVLNSYIDDASTEITLPVINEISSEVGVKYSTTTSGFEDIENYLTVVPNFPEDDNYEIYVCIDYTGNLDVKGYAVDKDGNLTDDIEISRRGNVNVPDRGVCPVFSISSNKDKGSFNGEYKVHFEVGYQDYAYQKESKEFDVYVRERVNKIKISTNDIDELSEDSVLNLYSCYGISKGERLDIQVLPTTVIDMNSQYTISLSYSDPFIDGPEIDENFEYQAPVEFWWKNNRNNTWERLSLSDEFVSDKILYESLYIKANEGLKENYAGTVEITFTSVENDKASTTFKVKLFKSANESEFSFEDTDANITIESANVNTKDIELTLQGQSTIDGLYVESESTNVIISGPTFVSSETNSVTFKLSFILRNESVGLTKTDKYQIKHQNGLSTDMFDIEIFLPLQDVGVIYDATNNTNSVTNYTRAGKLYDKEKNEAQSNIASVDSFMLKNNSNTPILYQFNSANGNSAVSKISVTYLDKGDKKLINEVGSLIEGATETSSIVDFTTIGNNSYISTKGVGYTYAVLKFEGSGLNERGEKENVCFYRIIFIESYVSPDGLTIAPQKDRQVSLYSYDSVSSEDLSETTKDITILFDNAGITHKDLANFDFESSSDMGDRTISGGGAFISWADGRYNISNINIIYSGGLATGISFTINALTTKGDYSFSDGLTIHYILRDGESKVIYDIYTTIDITIKNAQRVEKLQWVNERDGGVDFRLGSSDPYYLVFATSTTTSVPAKNLNLTSIVTDSNGTVVGNFVTVSDHSQSTLAVNLSNSLTQGMKGYIYVLPQDAIYDGLVRYYYKQGSNEVYTSLSLNDIGKNYDFLVNNAYFKSNATTAGTKDVSFEDILLKIDVEVNDGRSFEYAYKVYSVDDFLTLNTQTLEKTFDASLYYNVMRNLDLTKEIEDGVPEFTTIDEFTGGIQGNTDDIVITLNKPFVAINLGIIKDITFIGDVEGKAFVAEINNGTISNVTIDTKGIYPSTLTCNESVNVGGIAGENSGTIENSKVLGLTISASNCTVGGIAGNNAGTITDCLVEFYNLETGVNRFTGSTTVGAIVGSGTDAQNSNAYKYSNANVLYNGEEPSEGQPEYKAPTGVTNSSFVTIIDRDKYYKSLAVDADDANDDEKAIFFYYALSDNSSLLSETELRDITDLNTISLKDLLGQDAEIENVVVTSSDSNIVSVTGTTLTIKGTGDVTISLYSKKDVSLKRDVQVKVLNAVSKLEITWTDKTNRVNVVADNSQIGLQKTKSRTFNVDYSLKSLYLGNMAREFTLTLPELQLVAMNTFEQGQDIASGLFTTTAEGTQNKTITIQFKNTNDEAYLNSLNSEFNRTFTIRPVDGVIEFDLSENNLPITPSVNGTIRVRISTTADNDEVIPVILDGENSLIYEINGDLIKYSFPLKPNNPVIEVRRTTVSYKTQDNVRTFVYDVNFAVCQDYRVSEEMTFNVYFESTTGSTSLYEKGGVFELTISKQNFTNLDITNMKIKSSKYQKLGDNNYETVHETGMPTGILSPGTSSVLRVNINPSFAYYDYMEISYSDAPVIDAINIERLVQFNSQADQYIRTYTNTENRSSGLRYTPTSDEFNVPSLYFKIWVNTTVQLDTVIKFTVSFYKSDNTLLDYANYYLSVSYLKEPTILVDGEKTAFVAKGSTAQVEVSVLKDQVLDSLEVVGEDLKGIDLTNFVDNGIDEQKGIRTYSAVLGCSVLAEATNNTIYLQGVVSRELNGSFETKTARATVKIVDFKLDTNNIAIDGVKDGVLEVWLGVAKPLVVNYNLLPETYTYDYSDADSRNAVQQLRDQRTSFIRNQKYENKESNYYINYDYDNNGILQARTIEQRLFYVVGNDAISITDKSKAYGVKFDFDSENGTLSITGNNKISDTVKLKLETYVYADNVKVVYETEFTVVVTAYSDEDIPLTIENSEQFLALKPSTVQSETQTPQDYILINDIILEDYAPFNTSLIRSLDGNGYTIFIKSFNLRPSDTSTLNIALFTDVQSDTILKNIRVNLYNGGQLTVDKSTYSTIDIAGLAIRNEGVIYNCEVVSYYTDKIVANAQTDGGEYIYYHASERHTKPSGINVKYVNGENTSDPVYITDGSSWSTRVAGFVLENSGSIVNSRVGGDHVTIVNDNEFLDNYSYTGFTNVSRISLATFYISGQGDMAGFVLENTGSIAASFAKNIDMQNYSNTTRYYVSGFVGKNHSSVITSCIEGVQLPFDKDDDSKFDGFIRTGSSLKSSYGYISGFVYENDGTIKESYSNILISNESENQKVYLVSGFVYANSGELKNCYSASQIVNTRYSQMNFSGVDENGNLLANGTYTNCYYFSNDFASEDDIYDNSIESQYNTGATIIANPRNANSYYGFALASSSESNDGIWILDEMTGLSLIETDSTTFSHRCLSIVENTSSLTNYGQNAHGNYLLPYSTIVYDDITLSSIDTTLGGYNNPIIVTDAEYFRKVTGTSTSTYITCYFNNNLIDGANYRLVKDINLSDLTATSSDDEERLIPTVKKTLKEGRLSGNGFTISKLSITSDTQALSYGLFASLNDTLITNLNIQVSQIDAGSSSMVGGLAGYAINSTIINVDIDFENNANITGFNFAGGLLGASFKNTTIKNIIVENPNVVATKYYEDSTDKVFNKDKIKDLASAVEGGLTQASVEQYSYAGGVIGYVDHYKNRGTDADFNYTETMDYSLNNIKVNGDIFIRGSVAGGLFGLVGFTTNVEDAGITINGTTSSNSSKILATNYYAGGVVGHSFGGFDRIFARYEEDTQNSIEDNLGLFYQGNQSVERGAIDIFYTDDGSYTQKYVGGLIGYAERGSLTVSYSKLNVIALTADYAGGVIGGINVTGATEYNFKVKESEQQTKTIKSQYMLNEVYATGDIRASIFAGGIFGAIQKQDKNSRTKVTLLSVNALNYITNYNYFGEEGEDFIDLSSTRNISANFKINVIVGHLLNGNDVEKPSVLTNTTNAYLNFFQIILNPASSTYKETFGYYESYTLSSTSLQMNLFGEISNEITNNPINSDQKYIFAVESPYNYNSQADGHLYTQNAFLNTERWSANNWEHNINKLLPEIKYVEKPEVIYLDCYEISETIDRINDANSFVKVIVRGETAKGSNQFSDIIIDSSITKKINDFSGSLIGTNIYKTNDGAGEQVKIVSKIGNFISSVKPGFKTKNLIVEYRGNSTIDQGLFINSSISGVNIRNLTIIISNPLTQRSSSKQDCVGLIAPTIENSTLSGIDIKFNCSTTQTALAISRDSKISSGEFNIGLVAGKLIQTSSVEVNKVEKIKLSGDIGNFIQVASTSQVINIGTYFGQVIKESESGKLVQDLKVSLSDLNSGDIESNILLYNINKSDSTINIGGYIGKIKDLTSLSILPEVGKESIKIKNVVKITGKSNIGTLNHGMIAGLVETSSLSLNGMNASPTGGLYTSSDSKSITNLNAGGIYGNVNVGSVSISNFPSISYEVAGLINNISDTIAPHHLDVNDLSGNYDNDDNNKLKTKVTNANVGVVVGSVTSAFSFSGGNLNSSTNNSFRLDVDGEANVGVVVGCATTSGSAFRISGNISSNLQVLAVEPNDKDATLNFGGAVGQINTGKPNVQIGSQGNSISYTGGVFSNVKNVNYGGLLGEFSGSTTTSGSLELRQGEISGALKVFGANSNEGSVYAGGVVGNITKPNSTSIKIHDNKLWGDVFVEYDVTNLKKLNSYYFGGIIGKIDSYNSLTVSNNASAMTSHNARYEDKTITAHALFGSGVSSSNTNTNVSTNITDNYYCHSVVLLTDDFGIDCGYAYAMDGYKGNKDSNTTDTIIEKLTGLAGQKLNPINVTLSAPSAGYSSSSPALTSGNRFNGMTYYSLTELSGGTIKVGDYANQNVALIGYGIEHTFRYNMNVADDNGNKSQYYSDLFAPIDSLDNYSFVSSVLLNVDINVDSEASEGVNYAGLVKEMKGNSILYASQVKGKIEVGGDNKLNISGLVGKLTAGKISSCSTDVDIVYRAAQGGSVYGLVQLDNEGNNVDNKVVENTYSAGSIKTYIDANIHAFTQGRANSHINNCYTITRIFWDDYTVENKSHNSTVITAFGRGSTLIDCYYDSNALDCYNCGATISGDDKCIKGTATLASESISKTSITNSVLNGKSGSGNSTTYSNPNTPWTQTDNDFTFNYGYPTLRFGYLKVSSFATRDELNNSNTGYDQYVYEYTYTRLTNNTQNSSAYFMLVNKGVVGKISAITKESASGDGDLVVDEEYEWADKNFILPYNINTTSMFNTWTFKGNFDGCGNTISGLTSRFFGDIEGDRPVNQSGVVSQTKGDIRNIRIVDFYSLDNDNKKIDFNKSGILANTIKNATISNLFVSGNIDISSASGFVGALTNIVSNSEINTTTNATQFNVTATATICVGGFVGISSTTTMIYNSNYGNINLETSTASNGYTAGGLVGLARGTTIDHSYNVASIISGYTSSASANYHAGGLVGQGRATITNSYNSGMIKAGNKSSGETENTGAVKGVAYAGGIIAYGDSVIVNNCFNEGTVEALGKNPTTEYDVQYTGEESLYYPTLGDFSTGNSYNSDVARTQYKETKIKIIQTSAKNVYAYGIGYVNDTSSLSSVSNANNDLVFNNGSYKTEGNNTITTIDITNLFNNLTSPDDVQYYSKEYTAQIDTDGDGGNKTFIHRFKLDIKPKRDIQLNENNKLEIYTKSQNSLGIPNSFTFKTTLQFIYSYGSYRYNHGHGRRRDYDLQETFPKDAYLSCNFDDSIVKYFENQDYISNKHDSSGANLDKSSFRSQENGDNSATKIGSKSYYLVDKNNSDAIFTSGIYIQDITLQLDSVKIPYVNNKNCYSVEITGFDGGVQAKDITPEILGVEDEGDKYYLKIRFSSAQELKGGISYTVNCNYNENDNPINLSGLKYIYRDSTSYDIDIGNRDLTNVIYKNATIEIPEEDKYSVVKAALEYIPVKADDVNRENYSSFYILDNKKEFVHPTEYKSDEIYYEKNTSEDKGSADEGDSSYVYFVYDSESHCLIYKQEAELTRGSTSGLSVNNHAPKLNGTYANFKASIDWLSSQTLYFRTAQNDMIDNYISSFTNNGEINTYSLTLEKDSVYSTDNKKTVEGNIAYGKSEDVTPIIEYSDLVLTLTGGSFDVTVKDNTNQEIVYQNEAWENADNGKITINNKKVTYSVSISGKKLTITIQGNEYSPGNFDNWDSFVTNVKNCFTIIGSPDTNEWTNSGISFTFSQPSEDAILLYNPDNDYDQKSVVVAYGASQWITSGNQNSIKINSNTFDIAKSDSGELITLTSKDTGVEQIANKFTLITNDFSKTSSHNSPITNKDVLQASMIGGENTVDYYYVGESWTGNISNLDYDTDNNGKLTVKFNNNVDGLTQYSVNNVTIYCGSLNYTATHDYKVKFGMFHNQAGKTAYAVSTIKGRGDTLNGETQTNGSGWDLNANNISFDDNNEIKLKVTFYPELVLGNNFDDGEDYEVTLTYQNDAGETLEIVGDFAPYDSNNIMTFTASYYNINITAETFSEYYTRSGSGTEADPYDYTKSSEWSDSTPYFVFEDGTYKEVASKANFSNFYTRSGSEENYTYKTASESEFNEEETYYEVDKVQDENKNEDDFNAGMYYVLNDDGSYINAKTDNAAYDSLKEYYIVSEMLNVTADTFSEYYTQSGSGTDADPYTYTKATSFDDDETYYIQSGDSYLEAFASEASDHLTAKFKKGDNNYYLAIYDLTKQGFNFTPKLAIEDDDESDGCYYTQYVYAWEENGMLPEHSIISWDPRRETKNITYSLSYDTNTTYESNGLCIISGEGHIDVVLKKSGDENINVSANPYSDSDSKYCFTKTGITADLATETQEPHNIVLIDDVSFKRTSPLSQKEASISIIGNGYSIAYMGEALYGTINIGADNYIRDVKLLSNSTKYVLAESIANDNTLTLKNISSYGTINNFANTNSNSVLVGSKSENSKIEKSESSNIKMQTLKTYVNVNGQKNIDEGKNPVNLNILPSIENSSSDLNNYGVIIAKNGADGAPQTSTEGGDGTNGGSINASTSTQSYIKPAKYDSSAKYYSLSKGTYTEVTATVDDYQNYYILLSMSNQGIVKAGDGGNAGGGGDSVNNEIGAGAIAGYAPGTAGNAGAVSGFNTNVESENGYTALSGVTGRLKYGKLLTVYHKGDNYFHYKLNGGYYDFWDLKLWKYEAYNNNVYSTYEFILLNWKTKKSDEAAENENCHWDHMRLRDDVKGKSKTMNDKTKFKNEVLNRMFVPEDGSPTGSIQKK